MIAEKFATIRNGKIVSLTDATPAQELKKNQIPLTSDEYKLLHALPLHEDGRGIDLQAYFRIMDSVFHKMYDVEDVDGRKPPVTQTEAKEKIK